MKWSNTRLAENRLIRFLVSGGLNTAATYGIYLLLLNRVGYGPSYSAAFAAGILMSYFANRYFVFRAHQGIKTVLLFPLVYLLQYLVGLAVLWIWIDLLDWDGRLGHRRLAENENRREYRRRATARRGATL